MRFKCQYNLNTLDCIHHLCVHVVCLLLLVYVHARNNPLVLLSAGYSTRHYWIHSTSSWDMENKFKCGWIGVWKDKGNMH